MSAETLEAAERQAAADPAQLEVARAQASLAFGAAPWLAAERRDALLAALARGDTLLVSASFPSGLPAGRPADLALRRVGRRRRVWTATKIWCGPADPSVPGPTLLALLSAAKGLGFGERLTASVATRPSPGAVVPASAMVLAGGEAWCYVQIRRRVHAPRVDSAGPSTQATSKQRAIARRQVVVAGAGLLLARELGGGAAAD